MGICVDEAALKCLCTDLTYGVDSLGSEGRIAGLTGTMYGGRSQMERRVVPMVRA